MKSLSWFCAFACACLATGCGAGANSTEPLGDPVGFKFESTAGSFASFGWTGEFHHVVEPAGTPFGVEVTSCNGGVCRFEGPTDPGGEVNRRRCLFRMSQTCSTDADCPPDKGTATPCVYIYDAPLATPLRGRTGKFGACAWSYIPIAPAGQPPSITGTLNLASGALNFENLTILLPFNSNDDGTFRGACAECVGDKTFNDGVRDGRCRLATELGDPASAAAPDMSPDIGMACDVNHGGEFQNFGGNYSMDCSPTVIRNKNPSLQFGGSFSSSGFQIAVSAASPDSTFPATATEKTFCGMCSDNVTACMSDRDCGTGQCKTDANRFTVAGDNCAGGCNWDPISGVGTCMSNAPSHLIGCYPSGPMASIMASGHEERIDHIGTTYLAHTAGARCIPPGTSVDSALLNMQVGLPGLLFQKRNFQITPQYAEDKR